MKKSVAPSTLLSPVPNVLVSVGDMKESNIITIGWTGIVCSDPPRTYVSIRGNRFSHAIVSKTKEFIINLVPESLLAAAKFCGSRSGRDTDKFAQTGLTKAVAQKVRCPVIAESPLSMECKVFSAMDLGSHTLFLADIVAVSVDEKYLDGGKVDLDAMGVTCYIPGGAFAAVKPILTR